MATQTPETLDVATLSAKLPKAKVQLIDMSTVKIHPDNFRFDGGNNELKIDNTQLGELKDRILIDKRILKKPALLKTAEGLFAMTAGRRTRVAHALIADPNTPQEVVENLRKTECDVYEDLTDEQVLYIINDQDQKEFSYSEVLELALKLFDKGLNWKSVSMKVYRQWAKVKGQAKILNEVDTLQTTKEREARIGKWLRGTIDEVIGEAHRIGAMCVTQLRLEAAEKDRLIKTVKNTPKDFPKDKLVKGPEVLMNQKRLDILRNMKTADMNANEWNGLSGGPKFQEAWNKYKNEDLGFKEDGVTPLGDGKSDEKAMTRDALQKLATTKIQSPFGIKMIGLASGNKNVKWEDDDKNVAAFEDKLKYLITLGEELRAKAPEAYAILKMCLNDLDVAGFKKHLDTLIGK